jgi:hypothetical protein
LVAAANKECSQFARKMPALADLKEQIRHQGLSKEADFLSFSGGAGRDRTDDLLNAIHTKKAVSLIKSTTYPGRLFHRSTTNQDVAQPKTQN